MNTGVSVKDNIIQNFNIYAIIPSYLTCYAQQMKNKLIFILPLTNTRQILYFISKINIINVSLEKFFNT